MILFFINLKKMLKSINKSINLKESVYSFVFEGVTHDDLI